jgi:tRNA nucleotidyltransferase/poly(A) polymerase
MKKLCALMLCAAVVFGTAALVQVRTVEARAPYLKQFSALYVKKDSTDPNEKALATAVETAKCGVCHPNKDSKKDRNDYGKALGQLLKNEKDAAKIDEALTKVAGEKSPSGPTYGEIIKSGKLPGGG